MIEHQPAECECWIDGRSVPGRAARAVAARALEHAPAEVRALRPAAPREVDLLDRVLADVADRDVAGRAVEREAERVAQAVRRRPGGVPPRGRVDAQDLAEQRAPVLAVARTGRPRRRRRPSRCRAARRGRTGAGRRCGWRSWRCPILTSDARGGSLWRGRRRRGGAVLEHAQVAVAALGEEDVELARGLVVGRERHRQQAALGAAGDVASGCRGTAASSCGRSRTIRIRPGRSTTKTRSGSPGAPAM